MRDLLDKLEQLNESNAVDNIITASKTADSQNMKVVLSHGGKFIVVPYEDPRDQVVPNEPYVEALLPLNAELKKIVDEYKRIDRANREARWDPMNGTKPWTPPSDYENKLRKQAADIRERLKELKSTTPSYRKI